jgi:hypothetical protein
MLNTSAMQSRALGRKISDEFTVPRLAGEGTKMKIE